jgi:DNA-binding XRE family transcriptional regulator
MSNKYHSPSPAPTKPTRPSEAEEKAELFKPISEDLQEIGLNIAKQRSQRNMTQTELGAALDVGRTTVIAIENGKTDFKISYLVSVCEAFHIDPSEILPDRLKTEARLSQELQVIENQLAKLDTLSRMQCMIALQTMVTAFVISHHVQ